MAERIFGKYEKIRRLAQGGMGDVYLGRQSGVVGFDRLVILKSLRMDLAAEEGFVEQFLDEARVAANLNHPNVISVYEVGEWEGVYYIAMEYIAGEDLSRLWYAAAKKGLGLPFSVTVQIVHDAAIGLAHAHNATDVHGRPLAIVHRDVSPQNIMVRGDGVTKVVDFGIAKAANRVSKTKVGTVKGKLQYMSPEQVRGEPLDGRCDQFSLGVVLWEMCTGKRLFKAESEIDTLNKILTHPIPTPSSIVKNFPAELETVIMRMLERDRLKRFDSCRDMASDLDGYIEKANKQNAISVAGFVDQVLGEALRERTADLTPETVDEDHQRTTLDGPAVAEADDDTIDTGGTVLPPDLAEMDAAAGGVIVERLNGWLHRFDSLEEVEEQIKRGELMAGDRVREGAGPSMALGEHPELSTAFMNLPPDIRLGSETDPGRRRRVPGGMTTEDASHVQPHSAVAEVTARQADDAKQAAIDASRRREAMPGPQERSPRVKHPSLMNVERPSDPALFATEDLTGQHVPRPISALGRASDSVDLDEAEASWDGRVGSAAQGQAEAAVDDDLALVHGPPGATQSVSGTAIEEISVDPSNPFAGFAVEVEHAVAVASQEGVALQLDRPSPPVPPDSIDIEVGVPALGEVPRRPSDEVPAPPLTPGLGEAAGIVGDEPIPLQEHSAAYELGMAEAGPSPEPQASPLPHVSGVIPAAPTGPWGPAAPAYQLPTQPPGFAQQGVEGEGEAPARITEAWRTPITGAHESGSPTGAYSMGEVDPAVGVSFESAAHDPAVGSESDELDDDDGVPRSSSAKWVAVCLLLVLFGAPGVLYLVDRPTFDDLVAPLLQGGAPTGPTPEQLRSLMLSDDKAQLDVALKELNRVQGEVGGETRARAAAGRALVYAGLAHIELERARLLGLVGARKGNALDPATEAKVEAAEKVADEHRVAAYKGATLARAQAGTMLEAHLAMAAYQALRGAAQEMEADFEAALKVASPAELGWLKVESLGLRALLEARRGLTAPEGEQQAALSRALGAVRAARAAGQRASPPIDDGRLVYVETAVVVELLSLRPGKVALPAGVELGAADKMVKALSGGQPKDARAEMLSQRLAALSAGAPSGQGGQTAPSPGPAGGAAAYDSLKRKADAARHRGQTYKATSLYRKALKAKSTASAWTGLAWCYLDTEKNDQAVQAFDRALALRSSYGEAIFGKAEALRFSGRRSAAVRAYKRYLQVAPDGEDAAVARNALRSLGE